MFSSEEIKTMNELREAGTPYERIAEAVNSTRYKVQRFLDPDYAERRRLQIKARRQGKVAEKRNYAIAATRAVDSSNRVPVSQLPPIPQDTRDLTGRLMGDPLVGRRALDMVMSR